MSFSRLSQVMLVQMSSYAILILAASKIECTSCYKLSIVWPSIPLSEKILFKKREDTSKNLSFLKLVFPFYFLFSSFRVKSSKSSYATVSHTFCISSVQFVISGIRNIQTQHLVFLMAASLHQKEILYSRHLVHLFHKIPIPYLVCL